MKLTKYDHACIVLEEQGKKLVIDPGDFTKNFGDLNDIIAVVVTHVHGDHFSPEHLQTIIDANANVKIFTAGDVQNDWHDPHAQGVTADAEYTVGPFTLFLRPGTHDEIHRSAPRPNNLTVLVNDTFYYPGDSLTLPDRPIAMLAVPACAPWLNVGEAMDFMIAIKPTQCFPTHNAMLSEIGQSVTDAWLNKAAVMASTTYATLQPGESIKF